MGHKLLLADDSVTIQRVIELTFADEDVQVLAVGDGKQAIARVQADRPDIVLADVGMPERDGYEVAEFIKNTPDLAHIPVLLLTGAFEPVDETRAQAVGCDGVLVKPFEPQMVINRVKDLLAGRRPQGVWSAAPSAAAPSAAAPAVQPAPVVAAPPNDADLRAAAPAPSAGTGSLEDYFDRLDAAFASLDGGSPAAAAPSAAAPVAATPSPAAAASPFASPLPVSPVDDLAAWDPDLTGGPERKPDPPSSPVEPMPAVAPAPAPVAPPAVFSAPAPSYAPPASYVPPASYSPPAQAAAAPAPSPVPSQPPVAVPSLAAAFAALLSAEQAQPIAPAKLRPSMVSDDVIDEIVRRVSERLRVQDTVLDVAERLVREELAKIRGA